MTAVTYPDKELSEARIRAAARGITLHRQEDERGDENFIATRGPLTKTFPTLATFLAWLGRTETRNNG